MIPIDATVADAIYPAEYGLWARVIDAEVHDTITVTAFVGTRSDWETSVTIDLDRKGAQELINALQRFIDPKIWG